MNQTLRQRLADHPTLARALRWDPEDATLSGSERALAGLVAVLAADFDALDGPEQRALADVIAGQARETEEAEAAARRLLGR